MSANEVRRFDPVAALQLAAFFILLLTIAGSMTVTVDEFADVPAGLLGLEQHDFSLDARNPPLLKMLLAVPAAALDAHLPAPGFRRPEVGWWPWIHGTRFLRENAARYDTIFFQARVVNAVLATVLGALIYVVSRRRHGVLGARLSLALFILSPTVLAHGALATLDLGAALFGFAAVVCLEAHVRRPKLGLLIAAGLLLGAALASKFTSLLLPPAMALGLLAAGWRGPERRPARALGQMAVLALAALIALQAAYFFAGGTVLSELSLRSGPVLLAAALTGALPVPLPRDFVVGVDDALAYSRAPELPGYLNGEWSKDGWWYYQLEAFAVKEPLALLILLALAAACTLRRGWREGSVVFVIPPVLFVLSLLFWNRVQYGVRYGLPVYPYLFVGAGSLAALAGRRSGRAALAALVALLAGATLWHHPHQLSFFNSLVGGPAQGWHYLADSNVDWGQDLERLALILRRDYPGRSVKLAYFGHVDPAHYGIPYEVLRGPQDAHGLVAVSANYLAGEPYAVTWRGHPPEAVAGGVHMWLGALKPVARAGFSIYLYELP